MFYSIMLVLTTTGLTLSPNLDSMASHLTTISGMIVDCAKAGPEYSYMDAGARKRTERFMPLGCNLVSAQGNFANCVKTACPCKAKACGDVCVPGTPSVGQFKCQTHEGTNGGRSWSNCVSAASVKCFKSRVSLGRVFTIATKSAEGDLTAAAKPNFAAAAKTTVATTTKTITTTTTTTTTATKTNVGTTFAKTTTSDVTTVAKVTTSDVTTVAKVTASVGNNVIKTTSGTAAETTAANTTVATTVAKTTGGTSVAKTTGDTVIIKKKKKSPGSDGTTTESDSAFTNKLTFVAVLLPAALLLFK